MRGRVQADYYSPFEERAHIDSPFEERAHIDSPFEFLCLRAYIPRETP